MSPETQTPEIQAEPQTVEAAKAIADTILYEGYILYPYRASHPKNQAKVRWQFGVLFPHDHAQANPLPAGTESVKGTISGAAETWYGRTECIAEPTDGATVTVRLRFLQVQVRYVEAKAGEIVDQLNVDGQLHVTWEEGLETELDYPFALADITSTEVVVPVELPGAEEIELLSADRDGPRLRRVRHGLSLRLRVAAEPLPGPYGIVRLAAVVENFTDWSEVGGGRDQALGRSAIATNLLLSLSSGAFVSMLDPPEWARPAVASCTNEHLWPVLIAGDPRLMLASPMVLPDHPEVAPESPMDLCDGLENDEILSLRIMTLTDEEKAEARATDPRAAAIIDKVDNLPPEIYERLHGAIRNFDMKPRIVGDEIPQIWLNDQGNVTPDPFSAEGDAAYNPDTDRVMVQGVDVTKGSRVRLHPAPGVSDAQDMFLEGREASVQAVLFDLESEPYLAVTLDDDPMAAEIMIAHGRYLYFKPHEVEPLS